MQSPTLATGVHVEHVSPAELYEVLAAASSQDPSKLEAASKRLKQMLDMFGTFDGLHEIAAQRTFPLPIRQQAMIQFKNSALNHWKSRKLLSDEQRNRIRQRSFSFLDEGDETIATYNRVVVSRLARHDFPSNWPNLVSDLMTGIDGNLQKRYVTMNEDDRDALMLRRGLNLLNGILKELTNIKTLAGVRTMSQVAEQLCTVLYGYYSNMASHLSPTTITTQTINSQRVCGDLLLSHIVYKCLVKMAVWMWNRLDKVPKEEHEKNQAWLREFFQNSTVQVQGLVALRTNITVFLLQTGTIEPTGRRSIDFLTRHIRAFGKFFRRLQQLSQSRFASLPMCGDLILFYWSQVVEATAGSPEMLADSTEAVFPTRFLVQGMVLFKESLAQWTPIRKDGTPNTNSLSREFVENAVRLLVSRFMPLNPKDLETWMADPEEWVNIEDKENDLWEFELRPCSERVLVQLSNQYASYVTPLLEATFKQVASQPSVDLASVVQKEALYCAVGRCALRLKDIIPFDQWLESTLIAEARETNPNYPIIKRRIAWVIGKWLAEGCASPKNPRVWEILVHLLTNRGPGTDAVVRLTAAVALKEGVDILDFDADVFQPFLPVVVNELMTMIRETDTAESKRRIDSCLNVIIEQSGPRISPLTHMITDPLPQIWTAAQDDWLLKASLLVTVTKLVEAIKEQSTPLGGIVVPLVREGLSPGIISFLDEDALSLWASALQNTISIASIKGEPALSELFPQALQLLESNLDLLSKIIYILESYFFLDAPGILQAHGVNLFRAIRTVLKSGAITLLQRDTLIALNFLLQMAPSALWGEPLHNSGLFTHLMETLIEGESPNILLTEIIYILSRIVMSDRQMFRQLMSATAPLMKMTEEKLYEILMDQWWAKFDSMSEPRHRKLVALSTAALVSTCQPQILERIPTEIFNLWLDVFGEIKESQREVPEDEDGSPVNSLRRHWELNEAPAHYYRVSEGTTEYGRRKAVYERDPVRNEKLTVYIATHLQETEAGCGPQLFQANYLSKADPAVLKQIQVELARG